jgi:hypothetical protein
MALLLSRSGTARSAVQSIALGLAAARTCGRAARRLHGRAEGLWALALKDFASPPFLRWQSSIDTKEERDEQHSGGTRLVAVQPSRLTVGGPAGSLNSTQLLAINAVPIPPNLASIGIIGTPELAIEESNIDDPHREAVSAMWDSVQPGLGWHARSSTAGQEPGHQIPHNRTDQPSQDDRAVISWSSRKPREIVFATAVER